MTLILLGIGLAAAYAAIRAACRSVGGILDPLAPVEAERCRNGHALNLGQVTCYRCEEISGRATTVEPWTPAEREAFGVNETDRLIARIEAELGEIEREKRLREDAKYSRMLRIAEPIRVEAMAWGESKPVTVLETDTFVPAGVTADGRKVWVQQ